MLKTLTGLVPYNSESSPIPFGGGESYLEIVRPGAFDDSLRSRHDVLARVEHDSRLLLGRVANRTLKLWSDTAGLHYEITLPATQVGADCRELVEAGTLFQSSFAFWLEDPERDQRWSVRPDGTMIRELLRVRLHDVSPVCEGAYPSAAVSMREDDGDPDETVAELNARRREPAVSPDILKLRLAMDAPTETELAAVRQTDPNAINKARLRLAMS
jgi:HK97 family phage prohead protease